MDFKEIISTIAVIAVAISTIVMIITCIWDIIKSNKFYKEEKACLELMRTTFKKEHDLRHAVVDFGDWLMNEFEKAKTEMGEMNTNYNDGKLTATQDIVGEFLNTLEEYIGDWDEDGTNTSN